MKNDLFTSAGIILFCGILLGQVYTLPKPRFESLGPAFFPKIVLYSIIVLSVVNIAQLLFAHWRQRVAKKLPEPSPSGSFMLLWGLPLLTVVYFFVYTLLMEWTDIPYVVLTFVYIVIGSWTLASFRRNALPVIVLVSACVTGFIYLLFDVFLHTIFP